MKFIEVEPGFTLNVESISQFEESRGGNTRVKTVGGQEFIVKLEYEAFKNLIIQTGNIEKSIQQSVAQLATQNRFHTP